MFSTLPKIQGSLFNHINFVVCKCLEFGPAKKLTAVGKEIRDSLKKHANTVSVSKPEKQVHL